jgi:acetyl-CoA acyltransferase
MAEVLAKEFRVSREAQDELAAESHRRAAAAGPRLAQEIVAVYPPSGAAPVVAADPDPRPGDVKEELARLAPLFDRRFGTVTTGNSAAMGDGAAVCLVASARRAREAIRAPLGRIRSYATAAIDPERMGLAPAHAVPIALARGSVHLRDIQLIELNETAAAVVLANEVALRSRDFAMQELGRSTAVGDIDRSICNVNGGAIAFGDPAGATGARLVLALLHEMRRRDVNLGLVALAASGGQGGAMVLER